MLIFCYIIFLVYLFRLAIINFVLPQKDDNFGVVSTATDGCGQSTVFGSGGLVFRNIPLNNVAGFRNVIVKMNFQFVGTFCGASENICVHTICSMYICRWNSFRKTTNQIVRNPTAVDVSMADWIIIIICKWKKRKSRGYCIFSTLEIDPDLRTAGSNNIWALLIIPAGHGNETERKSRTEVRIPKIMHPKCNRFLTYYLHLYDVGWG